MSCTIELDKNDDAATNKWIERVSPIMTKVLPLFVKAKIDGVTVACIDTDGFYGTRNDLQTVVVENNLRCHNEFRKFDACLHLLAILGNEAKHIKTEALEADYDGKSYLFLWQRDSDKPNCLYFTIAPRA